MSREVIYTKYTNYRAERFNIVTTIYKENGRKRVEKKPVSIQGNMHIRNMYENYNLLERYSINSKIRLNKGEMIDNRIIFDYIEGRKLSEYLDELFENKNYQEAIVCIKAFVKDIKEMQVNRKFVKTEAFESIFGKIGTEIDDISLEVSNIDLAFDNIILGEEGITIIDYEWVVNFPVPFKFIVYRSIRQYLILRGLDENDININSLWKELQISQQDIEMYQFMDMNFQTYVNDGEYKLTKFKDNLKKENLDVRKMLVNINEYKYQVYIDYGNGFNEIESYREYFPNVCYGKHELRILIRPEMKQVRLDLGEMPCLLQVHSIQGLKQGEVISLKYTTNALEDTENILVFLEADPQILFSNLEELKLDTIECTFNISILEDEIVNKIKKLVQESNELIDVKKQLVSAIQQIGIIEKHNTSLEEMLENLNIEKNKAEQYINSILLHVDEVEGRLSDTLLHVDEVEGRLSDTLVHVGKVEKYLNDTLLHVNKVETLASDLIKEKANVEQYLASTLEHVTKLEQLVASLTIKGRIKRILKKIGLTPDKAVIMAVRNPQYIRKALVETKNNGLKGLKNKINEKKITQVIANEYVTIAQNNSTMDTENIMSEINRLEYKPILSIIMPVYNVDRIWLEKAIDSITHQTYPFWEICIADDASTKKETIDFLKTLTDSRIKILTLEKNEGISGASNKAVTMATGEYLILMDNDDEIREEALFEVAKHINQSKADILYSDEDKIDEKGNRKFPFLKPDWSPDLLHCQMYIGHLFIFRKALFEQVGGFRSEYNGSQDYDLACRMTEITSNVHHIPKVLYSWREIPTSTAMNPGAKPYAHTAGLRVLDEHLKRQYNNMAYAEETENLFVYDARFKIDSSKVKVSIIIPTKDKVELLEPCIDSILEKTTYPNYEIIILDNNSTEEKTEKWFNKIQQDNSNVKVIKAKYEFNWSKLNNHGIREATGDVFIFLNNDTIVISQDWMQRLAENAMREDIGTVGALLLYEDNTIQHAGVVLGMGGWADHVFKGMPPIHFGSPFISPMLNRNVLASTGACLAISRNTINKIGNFNEQFIICGSDVEISLRAREYGLNNLYNARVKLYHLESKSRDSYIPPIDFEMSKLHYQKYLDAGDPYYNDNLDIYSTSPKLKG